MPKLSVSIDLWLRVGEFLAEAGEQHHRGQHGGADRVTLGDRLGGVADRVERIGDVADLLGELRHLGDTAGVVGDRAEGVKRHDQAGERELTHDRHTHAVDAGGAAARKLPGAEDAEHEHERGERRGLQTRAEALDDVRGVTCHGRLRGLLDRGEARGGVVVGDHEQQRGDADADERAQVELAPRGRVDDVADLREREPLHEPVGDRRERRGGDHAGDDQALVESALDIACTRTDGEGADDRRDHRDAAENQRVHHHAGGLVEGEHAEQHHRDRGDGVGLEQVGGHAGAVAHVVAHVVGDDGGVAGIVLGDARLDLADDVGADVGGLREDAAAESCEDGDQRPTEAEPDERDDGSFLGFVEDRGEQAVVAGEAHQREPRDEHACDGAALEGDPQRGRHASAGGLGDTRVGAYRDVHADVAGRAREDAADREAAGDGDVLDEDERHEQHHADDGDGGVLTIQIGASAFLDRARDALHPLVSRR